MGIRLKTLLLAVLTVTGCGGGGSGTAPAPPPTPDDATGIIVFGTITRFGSVVANGTVFDCNSASVDMNDSPGNLADLRVGHVVAITATVRSQQQNVVAQRVGCLDEVEGPISSIDLDAASFTVLGRTVFFDELTVFENVAYDDLLVGNVVRVMGHLRHQERVQATHVELIANAYAAGMRMAVKGEITDLQPGLMQFRIGTQVCDYSAAMLELGGAELANGLYVEASSTTPLTNGDMLLDRIRARDRDQDRDRDHQCDSGCEFDLEGYITDFVAPTEFYVDGAPVTTTSSTVYVNGTVDTLAVDVRVALTGTLDDAGVLIADRIVFRLPSIIQIEADAEAIDTENATVTLLGIDVTTNDFTMFRDISEAAVGEFWLDDLAIGDRIEIRAYLLGEAIVATRLERDDADTKVTLKAPVEAITRPSLTMLGVTVTSDVNTVYQNAAREFIDADPFFDLVEVGTLVKAVGDYNGGVILADSLYVRECQNSCL
jgi:hypothetical protein